MASKKELQALIVLAGKVDPSLKNALKIAQNQTSKTSGKLNKYGAMAGKVMGVMGKATIATGAALVAGVAAGTAAVGKLISNITESADTLEKMRVTTGLNYEELQKLQYISSQLSVNFDSVQSAAGIMTKQMAAAKKQGSEAANAFNSLGIDVKDLSGKLRPQAEVFKESLAALSQVENQSERNALAFKIFGKGAAELFPILDAGTGEIQKLAAEADKLGIVMSDKQVSAAEQLGDTIDKVKLAASGLGNKLVSSVVPQVQTLLDGLINNLPQIQSIAQGFFSRISSGVLNILPKILSIAAQLMPVISQIFSAITDTDAISLIFSLLEPLIPLIIDLAKGVLPVLVQLIKIVLAILKPLIPVIVMLVEKLMPPILQILNALMPLLEALAPVISFLAELIGFSLANAIEVLMPLINIVTNAINIWLKIFTELINFIKNVFAGNWEAAWQNITNIFSTYWQGLGDTVKGLLNFIIGGMNGVIRGANKISGVIGKIIGKEFKIPEIPTFARGGFANRPSIFGEAGLEAAIPIKYKSPRSLSLLNQTAKAIGAEPSSNSGAPIFYFNPTIYGGNSGEVKSMLEAEYLKFKEMVENYFEEKARASYGPLPV